MNPSAIAGEVGNPLGQAVLFFVLALNCLGVPIASELILPLCGVAIRTVHLNFLLLLVVTISGQILGLSAAYLTARHIGLGPIERGGRFLLIKHSQILAVRRRFRRHSISVMMLGLLMPGVHGYMGFSAGLAKMSGGKFIVTTIGGTVVWTSALLGFGYLFGDYLPQVEAAGHQIGAIITIAIIVAGAVWYSRQRQKRRIIAHARGRRSNNTAKAR